MNVCREYRVQNPGTEQALLKAIAQAIEEKKPLKVEVAEVLDELSARRGQRPAQRFFEVRVFEINQLAEFFANGRVTYEEDEVTARLEVLSPGEVRLILATS